MTQIHETSAVAPAASTRPIRFHRAALALLLLLGVFALGASLFSGSPPNEAIAQRTDRTAQLASPETPSAESKSDPKPGFLGSWRDDYYGERTMTFRPDGTGTMIIKLDQIGQAIYGPQLLFHLKWENRDGVLVMQFTGGEPKDAVTMISKVFGDRHEQRIELLTETDLHLRSTDSQNLYMLQRVDE